MSAFEFRRLLKNDEDDRAFISDITQSGVPQMGQGIAEIATVWREEAAQRRAEATKAFVERVLTSWKSWKQVGSKKRVQAKRRKCFAGSWKWW